MQDKDQPLYQELTETILGCYFDVMNKLGVGFLESLFFLYATVINKIVLKG